MDKVLGYIIQYLGNFNDDIKEGLGKIILTNG